MSHSVSDGSTRRFTSIGAIQQDDAARAEQERETKTVYPANHSARAASSQHGTGSETKLAHYFQVIGVAAQVGSIGIRAIPSQAIGAPAFSAACASGSERSQSAAMKRRALTPAAASDTSHSSGGTMISG